MINIIQKAYAYTLLEPLPGIGGGGAEGIGLTDYLNWLFGFMLAAAAFLAVVQIVIAGIQMMIGGASETQISNAKSRIQDAIYGLLLALASWLILYTINPNLAQMKLTIPEVKIEAPTTSWTKPTYHEPSFCMPPCKSDELCKLDPTTETKTCVKSGKGMEECDLADTKSCPSGKKCVFDLEKGGTSCE